MVTPSMGKGGRTRKSQNGRNNFLLGIPVGERGTGAAGKETARSSALKISQSRPEWDASNSSDGEWSITQTSQDLTGHQEHHLRVWPGYS